MEKAIHCLTRESGFSHAAFFSRWPASLLLPWWLFQIYQSYLSSSSGSGTLIRTTKWSVCNLYTPHTTPLKGVYICKSLYFVVLNSARVGNYGLCLFVCCQKNRIFSLFSHHLPQLLPHLPHSLPAQFCIIFFTHKILMVPIYPWLCGLPMECGQLTRDNISFSCSFLKICLF